MSFHLWTINEVYTNADGSIQFIELTTTGSAENDLVGHTITSTPTGGAAEIFTIPDPDNISGDTTDKTLLFATQGFANLGIVTPDFIIPSNFLSIFDAPPTAGGEDGIGGILDVFGVDTLAYTTLPRDGTLSIDGNGVLQINSPTNFAGAEEQVPGPNAIEGTPAPDSLVGTAGADVIFARADNDTLVGGAGNDTMRGQAGDDRYIVSEAGDVVIESSNAGTDTVVSSLNYLLGPNVENLTLTGSALTGNGNTLANVINGNAMDNVFSGGDGTDTLDGSTGNDSIFGGNDNDSILGGDGNDTLQGNAGDDFVRGAIGNDEVRGGQGNDTVQGGQGLDVVRGAFGNDEIRGGLNDDQLFGGQNNDTLFGGQGNDTLLGLAHDDVLQGLAGNDTLTAGPGLDQFWFNSAGAANADTITDFDVGGDADTIVLQQLLVTGLSPGALAAGNFVSGAGAAAADANDFILYDTATGNLSYDADGNGGGAALLVATLTGAPAITEADFLIVA